MAGSISAALRNCSPIRCSEKPWDYWVTELGRSSPLRDEDATGIKGGCRKSKKHSGITRLKHCTMSLYGEFPSNDKLTVAVCPMCNMSVKLMTAHRHLLENHSMDPILPPPPPAVKLKSSSTSTSSSKSSKHKHSGNKEISLTNIVNVDGVSAPTAILHPAQESTPLSADLSTTVVKVPHIMLTSHDITAYYSDIDTSGSSTKQSEVKVSVDENDLPVVSIQDNTDLPLADDIIEIMNSEGIQSIEDITDADTAAWKNIMQDFGAIQDMSIQGTSILSNGSMRAHELYDANGTPVKIAGTYTLAGDKSTLQYTQPVTLQSKVTLENNGVSVSYPITQIQCASVKPPAKSKSSKSGKLTKFQTREYDPNKHCGVLCVDSQKPCTRSLTCKAHTLSLRRQVDGRNKSFDTLLAEHRAAKQASLSNTSCNVTNQNTLVVSNNMDNVMLSQTNKLSQSGSVNLASQANNLIKTLNESQVSGISDINTMEQSLVELMSNPTIVNQTDLVNQVNLTNQIIAQKAIPPNQSTVVGMSSPLVVSAPVDMNSFSEMDPDRQVTEYYNSVMSSISDVIGDGAELLVEGCMSTISIPPPRLPEPRPGDVYWYPSAPRPLASCTFSTCHMGNALVLGKRLATVRSNFKSTLSQSHSKNLSSNYYNFSQNSVASRVNKNLHVNNSNSKPAMPEVRKLIMSCPELLGSSIKTENAYFSNSSSRQNGHLYPSKRPLLDEYDDIDTKCLRQSEPCSSVRNKVNKHLNPNDLVEFMNAFDPLIANEKC